MRSRPSLSTTASTDSSHSRGLDGLGVWGVRAHAPSVPASRAPPKRQPPPGRALHAQTAPRACLGGTRAARRGRAGSGGNGSTPRARTPPRRAPRRRTSAGASLERPRVELGVAVAVLRPDGLPQLVVVLPRADEQEVEALAAAVQDHEAELAAEPELAQARSVDEPQPGQIGDRRRHGRVLGRDLVPLEQRVPESEALPHAGDLRERARSQAGHRSVACSSMLTRRHPPA